MRSRRNLARKTNKFYNDVAKKKEQQKDASSGWSRVSAEWNLKPKQKIKVKTEIITSAMLRNKIYS